MRYVNLKKRNTSKTQYVSKRLAAVSFACLALTAVIVVPLTGKKENVRAVNEPEVVEIANDYFDNDVYTAIND
jgi:hypothetical protein